VGTIVSRGTKGRDGISTCRTTAGTTTIETAAWLLAIVVAAAAKGQMLECSCSGEPPPFEGPVWCGSMPGMSMPAMSMSAISMADMSCCLVSVALAPGAWMKPSQITKPPGPGINPTGINARDKNPTNNNAASAGFWANLSAMRFFTLLA